MALSPEDRKARQAIWADIDRLHLRIVDKKREINRGLPIFRLNHDVMLEIFIHCALASMFPPFGYRPRGQKAFEWLNVTRVCHYWREVALNSPSLWSHFLLTNSAPRTRELLARSKRATLSVESDRETSISDGQVLELLFENIDRTRVLDIALDHRKPIPSIQLPLVAPQLTRFILRCDYRMQEPFPIPLKGCDMPKLSHLELHNVAITWPNSVLRASLTHLVITAPCLAIRQAPGLPPLPSLIDVLKDMPLLEHLDLKSVSHILRIPPSETRLLRLDHLRLLKLAEGGTLCASFLSHVIHPATACIHLSPDFSRNTSQDVKALRKAILEKLDGTKTVEGVQQFVTSAAFKSMSMGNTTEIVVWTSETSLEDLAEEGECFRASQNAFLRVRYNQFIPMPLRTVYKIIPLDNVTKLSFDEETAGIRDWIAISQSLPNVEHIVAQKSLKCTFRVRVRLCLRMKVLQESLNSRGRLQP